MLLTLNITRPDGTEPTLAELLTATERLSFLIFSTGLEGTRPVDSSDPYQQMEPAVFNNTANRIMRFENSAVLGSWNLTAGDVNVSALNEESAQRSLAQYIDDNPGEPIESEDYIAGHTTGFTAGRESVIIG